MTTRCPRCGGHAIPELDPDYSGCFQCGPTYLLTPMDIPPAYKVGSNGAKFDKLDGVKALPTRSMFGRYD